MPPPPKIECIRCKQIYPQWFFYPLGKGRAELRKHCKSCHNLPNKVRRYNTRREYRELRAKLIKIVRHYSHVRNIPGKPVRVYVKRKDKGHA